MWNRLFLEVFQHSDLKSHLIWYAISKENRLGNNIFESTWNIVTYTMLYNDFLSNLFRDYRNENCFQTKTNFGGLGGSHNRMGKNF